MKSPYATVTLKGQLRFRITVMLTQNSEECFSIFAVAEAERVFRSDSIKDLSSYLNRLVVEFYQQYGCCGICDEPRCQHLVDAGVASLV